MPLWDELRPYTSRLHGVVLDLGCGNGDYSRRLRQMPAVTDVWAVDIAPGSPEYAHGQNLYQNVRRDRVVQANAEDLSFFADGFFDCAMCWHCIEHTRRPAKALRELRRVTKDLIMFALPRKGYGAWCSEGHLQAWTEQEFLAQCLRAKLAWVEGPLIDSPSCMNWLFRVPKRG